MRAAVARFQPELDSCGHADQRDFKVSAHEWKCSCCGHVSVWRDSWSSLSSIGCRKCQREPAIEAVTCSDVCRKSYEYLQAKDAASAPSSKEPR